MQIKIPKKLQKQMENENAIRKYYGKLADKIILCLSVLLGANSLDDVPNTPPTRRHKLLGAYKECWGIDLSSNWRMVIRPAQFDADISKIIEVEIIDIVDYH